MSRRKRILSLTATEIQGALPPEKLPASLVESWRRFAGRATEVYRDCRLQIDDKGWTFEDGDQIFRWKESDIPGLGDRLLKIIPAFHGAMHVARGALEELERRREGGAKGGRRTKLSTADTVYVRRMMEAAKTRGDKLTAEREKLAQRFDCSVSTIERVERARASKRK